MAILSKREEEIVRVHLLEPNLTQHELARKLFIAEGTIHSHFENIHQKTGAKNDRELFHWFFQNILNVNLKNLLAS